MPIEKLIYVFAKKINGFLQISKIIYYFCNLKKYCNL